MRITTYGQILRKMVNRMCKYAQREEVFRRNDIPVGHWYNVINDNKRTSGDRKFYCPTEWGVSITRDSRDYEWARTVAKDCGGLFVSPEDIKEMKETDPLKALKLFQRIIGIIRKEEG